MEIKILERIKTKFYLFSSYVLHFYYYNKIVKNIKDFLSLGLKNCTILAFFFLVRIVLIIPAVVGFSIYYGIDKLTDIILNKEQKIYDKHNN